MLEIRRELTTMHERLEKIADKLDPERLTFDPHGPRVEKPEREVSIVRKIDAAALKIRDAVYLAGGRA